MTEVWQKKIKIEFYVLLRRLEIDRLEIDFFGNMSHILHVGIFRIWRTVHVFFHDLQIN